jgi:hypothetical protein
MLWRISIANSTEIEEKINRFLYMIQVGLAKKKRDVLKSYFHI